MMSAVASAAPSISPMTRTLMPSVVAMNEGLAKNVSSTTIKDDAYAYIVDQQGLMASLSIAGTKISRINK